MRSTAVRDGDTFVLNGSKTFITNGPFADTTVFICKLDDGHDRAPGAARAVVRPRPRDARVRAVAAVAQDGAALLADRPALPRRRRGRHRPADRRCGQPRRGPPTDRPPTPATDAADTRRSREAARAAFASERASVAAMALGIIEQCLDVAVDYARTRVQFGRPIGDFQLIQNKLALMEVARVNVQNMLFRYLETMRAGKSLTFAEASAIKLYSARAATEVALDAVQVLGGNGYMAEYHVEQLARDAKVLQIYAGTDELQTTAIAKDLLRR